LPEDIPLIIAGYLVANDQMRLIPACIFAWCGIIGGDLMLYHLGKKFGLEITRVPFIGKHFTKQRIEWVEHKYIQYGFWVVAIGRMVALVRGAMVVAAGTIRYNLVKFIIADGLAAVVSGGLWLALGYWLGTKFTLDQVKAHADEVKHWIILIIAVIVVIGVAWHFIRKSRSKAAQTPTNPPVDGPARPA